MFNTFLLSTLWQEVTGLAGDTIVQSLDNEKIELIISDTVPSVSNNSKGLYLITGEKLKINVSSKLYSRTTYGTGYLVYYSVDDTGGGDNVINAVTTSWESSFSSSVAPSTAFVIDSTYKDMTSLIGSFINTAQGPSPITYDPVKNRFHCSAETTDYYSFSLIWRLSGTVGASVNQSSEFLVELRRGDGVTILPARRVFMKVSGGNVTFTNEAVVDIKIRVFAGGNDPFQDSVTATGGFKIFVRKLSGNDLTLNFNDTTSPKIGNTVLMIR